ncbi:MAG: methyltransferase domain-containing protein [Kiloniellales bacterium]|nr:methyltransferase domain-containing protein [Kiloniellales bacterium]MDJ0983324.1 methyltransferase domain-containing protein [Kiloniellales bacterium]
MSPVAGDNSSAQHWDPERYARNARFVADLGAPLVELLAPQAGETILDLGCGDGALTETLVAKGAVVVGVDGSAEQVAAARARGLDARQADGQSLDFEAAFDAVFSNAALHWMRQADAVIAGVWRALKPGGRFVGEMGGAGNVAGITTALMAAVNRRGLDGEAANPWYFPTPEDYRRRLESQGFEVLSIALIDRPTPLPGPMADWLETFAETFLKLVPDEARADLAAEVSEALRPTHCDAEGRWTADYVRLRFSARKPG